MPRSTGASPLGEHYSRVYRFVRRRTAQPADAEDITQEVFLDVAAALERHKLGSPPTLAWLYTVAQRRLVDAHRRAARRLEAPNAAEVELAEAKPEYGADVSAEITRGIQRLPRLQCQVVTLKLLRGYSFSEIAVATNSAEGACRMRFVRGLEQLRDYLEGEGVNP